MITFIDYKGLIYNLNGKTKSTLSNYTSQSFNTSADHQLSLKQNALTLIQWDPDINYSQLANFRNFILELSNILNKPILYPPSVV